MKLKLLIKCQNGINVTNQRLFDTFDTENCFLTAVVRSNFKWRSDVVTRVTSELGRIRGSLPLISEIRADYVSAAPPWNRRRRGVRAVMRSGRNVFVENYYVVRARIIGPIWYHTYVCSLPWHGVTAIARRQGRLGGITSFTIFLRPSIPSVCYFYALSTVKFRSIDLPCCWNRSGRSFFVSMKRHDNATNVGSSFNSTAPFADE